MSLVVIVLFIWMIIIQIKLNDISNQISHRPQNQNEDIFTDVETEAPFEDNQINENADVINKEVNISENVQDTIAEEKYEPKSFDFENAFLGNIFSKIGAIAIIIGIIIFIKLVSPYITFTPTMKISLGYIAGISSFIFSLRMNEEKMKRYKETLAGTGVSILFITTYFASAFFHLISPVIATIIATIILLVVFVVADRQKTVSMITIALIAGYLNPLIANANASPDFLFGYYIFLNLLSLIYVYKNPNRDIINFVNLILTFIILSGMYILNQINVNMIYPIILWLIYLIYDILRKEKSSLQNDKNNILNWINFGVLALFTLTFLGEAKSVGSLLLSVGFIYLGLVVKYVMKKSDEYRPYLYSAFVIILLSTLFLTEGTTRIALWSFESLLLVLIAVKYKLEYLLNWAFGFIFASVTAVLTTDNIVLCNDFNAYKPILNTRTLYFIFPILASGLSYLLINCHNNCNYDKPKDIFKFSFISLIFLYIVFELNNYIYSINLESIDKEFISSMLISIIGFKYALQIKRLYNSSNFALFNNISYLTGITSLCILLTMGFVYKPIEYFHPVINVRFLAFLTAIITSAIFVKWTKFELLKYLCAVLGFVLVHIETCDFIVSSNMYNIDWLLTVMWILYAGTITLAGIFKNIKFMKYTGIWISIFAIMRIFVFDLAETDMLYKFMAFITLGMILMTVSYFYNKRR